MKKIKILTITVMILILSGCTILNTSKTNKTAKANKSEAQKSCESRGGTYNTMPGAAEYGNPCYIKYSDAEKKCTSSDQCQGNCVTNVISQMGKSGICEKDSLTSECLNKIENDYFICLIGDMVFACGKTNITDSYTISTCQDLKEQGKFFE